jgi:hypothetical protein
VSVEVADSGAGADVEDDAAREAASCMMEDASGPLAEVVVIPRGGVGTPSSGPRNMASIVGRRAAPNGVDRKSAGRSMWMHRVNFMFKQRQKCEPVM